MMTERKTYRKQERKYRRVEVLPLGAQTVSNYCQEKGFTNPYVYQLLRQGKADFEIVIFQGVNFVIPLTKI